MWCPGDGRSSHTGTSAFGMGYKRERRPLEGRAVFQSQLPGPLGSARSGEYEWLPMKM